MTPASAAGGAEGGALLETAALCKHFGGLKAVQDVDLCLEQGEIVALIGPNGAGKTTCFNCLTGADDPTSGDVRLFGRSIVGWPAWRVAQAGIGRTFQNIRLFKEMTVLQSPEPLPVGANSKALAVN